ncbi:ATP-binding protein [Deinococcus roseus]|uniref:ATPase AAA n=1 Tax=Deinococcus roseus TaxID=392414 RepID=A0ABQ2CZF9_9DEIO|nr:ATP-binding protein [Deinococcus roseus]GGJ35990.1 ATPase AAA [Deinococcus roseus]
MRLPIGIQDFQKLREGGYVYVDKTMHMMPFVQGGYYFFSRPRRFGKSLTLTTLKALFEGKKHLFEGLWIQDQHDFEEKPVIHINFNFLDGKQLETSMMEYFLEEAQKQGLELQASRPAEAFRKLVEQLGQKQPVVLLIDEYDKPLVDFIHDDALRNTNQEVLRRVYGTIKGLDEHLHLVLLTGVSRFGKLSLFSDLNNLYDATLDPRFAELCGYTREELQTDFAAHHQAAQKRLQVSSEAYWETLKRWYNGYSWDGVHRVYCPFSMLLFLQNPTLKAYWYETGTPTFLTKLVRQQGYTPFQLEHLRAGDGVINTASVEHLDSVSMMFQTGYLTLKEVHPSLYGTTYTLGFPNEEVRVAFAQNLLQEYTQHQHNQGVLQGVVLRDALLEQDWEAFFAQINTTLAGVPYEIFPRREAYFNSLVHLMLVSTGLPTQSQVQTSKGRMDTVLELPDQVFIFEFKLDSTAQEALDQIKTAGYAEKFAGKKLWLSGVNFDSGSKSVSEWVIEFLPPEF